MSNNSDLMTDDGLADTVGKMGSKPGEELKATTVVDDSRPAVRKALNEEPADIQIAEYTLSLLSEGRSLTVEAMNQALKKLKGVNVEIPDDEIIRMKSIRPRELSPEANVWITRLKDCTKGKKAPIIMQIPRKVIVDGVETPLSINNLSDIIDKAHKAGSIKESLWLAKFITDDDKVGDKIWDSDLRVWTSECLNDSLKEDLWRPGDQINLQKRLCGKGSEIHADMIIAMTLMYISTGEKFIERDNMRLNDPHDPPRYEFPIRVGSDKGKFAFLCGSYGPTDRPYGIGASLGISQTGELLR